MNKRTTLQKLTAFFLVFVMLLGIIVPNTVVFAEGKLNKDTITDFKKTDKETEEKINSKEQEDKKDNKTEVKDDKSEGKEEKEDKVKSIFNKSLIKSASLNRGIPMGNGKLVVYDDSHKINDASNGDGTSVNKYNLATMTNTLFTINYTPFYQVKDDGNTEFGDQRIVVDIPTYGFKLANPGIEGVQFEKITMLDAKGKVIPLDAVSQKNYDKVTKIIYDINDKFLGSLGGGSSLVFNIAFNRRSLTAEECEKWINEGKLETNLNVSACEGENNTPINSTGNPSEYKWKMSPINYEDTKTTVTGNRHLNTSSMAKIANSSFINFYDDSPQSGPFMGNWDYYYYKQGTVHDGDTPLMKLKHIKLFVPKKEDADGNFILKRFKGRKALYENELASNFTISEVKNDNDGKGKYYLITPKKPIYNNGSNHKWKDAFTNGFSPIWQVPDGIDNIGSDTLYEASTPEFVFETPNGIDGKKEVVISEANQGVKIKTLKAHTVDGYAIHSFTGQGYQLFKHGDNFYTANAVSPDANYSNVGYARLSNEYYILKDANGDWNEYFPKNKTGATVETYEFPKEIQPTAWTGTTSTWSLYYKVEKVVYTTEDGRVHEVAVNSYVHRTNDINNFPKVNFDTSGGRVTKVQVYWEQLNNEIFNADTYYGGRYHASTHRLTEGQSKFDFYVTPDASGLLQVKYSAKSTDSNADANDNFDYEASNSVKNPVNNVSGKAKDDFFWVTVKPKKCTPLKAESTGDRLKEKILFPNQAENGTFYDTWTLFFDYGKNKEFSPVTKNPRIDLTVGTLNLKGLDTNADKTGLLTGKFTANKSLSGWKIIYKTADNMFGVEGAEKVYNIGNIEDGTKIDLGINRDTEHLTSIVLTYDGMYNMDSFADKENGRVVLFSNIEYELRNTDYKGNPLTLESDKGVFYNAKNFFVQNLEGRYYNDNCSDGNHIHDAGKGQAFGGRGWNSIILPQRYGLLTRTYIVTNKTVNNVIEPAGSETNNSISQTGTSIQKVTFRTKAYAYAMNSDMPEKGKMPYGIPESAYVEITDKQFSADVDNCKFLGYDNASGNVKIEQIKDADGKLWIKMSITDKGIDELDRKIRKITTGDWHHSFYDYYNDGALKFLEDSIVIALKSFRYTSVTSPGENEHHPYGMVYYDMSKLESKLDGSKKEYYSYAKIEGDLFKLTENAANALNATKEKKLFGIDLSKVEVIVSKNTAVGSNIFPGKYDNIVYGTAGSKFPTQTFYPDEIDNLRGDFFVQAPDSDGFKDFKAIIEIPKKGKSISYTQQNETVQTPKTEVNMYLTGEVAVMGDSRPGKQEFSYSIDGGNTFVSAENITDWSKVTHVKLDLGELPKGSQVNIKLPLKTHAKTTTDELQAYIGGSFEATDYTGFKTSGYINPAKYIYGNFAIISSDVWWDKNENGKLDVGETKAKDIKLELYSPNRDMTINNKLIPANTLIHSTTTDENGRYELKSFMLDAGQWIKVTMPDGETKLTLKSKDSDMLEEKNSDFDRTSYKTAELPELVREKPLDAIGCGLIKIPKIKTETVNLHVGEESNEGASKAVATSDHPTVTPELKYLELQNDVADVDSQGKVSGKTTGKIKAEVTTTNTLASTNQAIPEDTVKAEYDIIVYGKVNYNKNHADVKGEAPKDNNEYYPSVKADGNDADTDKVTVLNAGTMKRAGYIFKGWNTQADGKGTMYSIGDTFKTGTLDKDVELYAIWSLIWTPMEIPTRDLKVTKTWDLLEGHTIPVNEVQVELFKDNVSTGKKLTLNEANNWTVTFKKLPVSATLGGANHNYTVKEVGESGSAIKFDNKWFGVTYGGTMKDGFTVTNKEKLPWAPMIPPTRDIKVTKEWKNFLGTDAEATVEKIEVELYKDGVATGKKAELTKANNWTATFEKLEVADKLGSTNYHQYTVKEVGENGSAIQLNDKWYGVSYAGTMKDGLTVTNKEKLPWTPMIPPTRDIKVTKEWKNFLGTDAEATVEKIEVELYRDGEATGKKAELTNENNWTATFEKLEVADKLGSTNYYQYTVKEVGEDKNAIQLNNKWYGVAYAGTMKDGFTITNKEKMPWTPMIPPTRDIKVTKEWKNFLGNVIEASVEKIEVELYKDGVSTGKKLELKKANNWTATFEKLEVADKLGSTNYYQYTVKEVGESGNAIQLNNKWYGVSYGGTMKDGFTITNKEKMPWAPMIPPTRDIKVTKEWKTILGTNAEASVEKIEVELYKDGEATGKKAELTKANNWTATFEKLEVADKLGSTNYYQYTVKEVGESGSAIQLNNKWYGVTYAGTMKDGFTITNKEKMPWAPMEIPTRNLKVTKTWELLEGHTMPVNEIEVELFKDNVSTGKKLTLNEANNWTATFEKLPVSATLGGANHNYTVKEVGESGFATKLDNRWFGVAYAGTMKDGFTITNKEKLPWTPMIPPTRDIKVTKEWKDIKGNIIEAPVEKIEVELYKDGVATGKKVELTKANNWTATFEKLEVADGLGSTNYYQYTVKEVGESGSAIQLNNKWFGVAYAGTMKDGFTITNKEKLPWTPMIPPTRDIKVTKEWKDIKGNVIEAPVEKIEVELYKDGVATGKKAELTKANNWTATFEKLEVADGLGSTNYYQYTVKEVGESGNAIKFGSDSYKVSYSGSMEDGFNITNRKAEIPKPLKPSTKLPKTGSSNDLSLYIYCILTSVTLLGLIVYRRKNIQNNV